MRTVTGTWLLGPILLAGLGHQAAAASAYAKPHTVQETPRHVLPLVHRRPLPPLHRAWNNLNDFIHGRPTNSYMYGQSLVGEGTMRSGSRATAAQFPHPRNSILLLVTLCVCTFLLIGSCFAMTIATGLSPAAKAVKDSLFQARAAAPGDDPFLLREKTDSAASSQAAQAG